MAALVALGVYLPAGAFRLLGGAPGVAGLTAEQIVAKYNQARSAAGACLARPYSPERLF